jgi:hypothetical protein
MLPETPGSSGGLEAQDRGAGTGEYFLPTSDGLVLVPEHSKSHGDRNRAHIWPLLAPLPTS